jgi:hypothetical protein
MSAIGDRDRRVRLAASTARMRSILPCGLTTLAQPVVELIPKRDVAENADVADVDRRVFSIFLSCHTLLLLLIR